MSDMIRTRSWLVVAMVLFLGLFAGPARAQEGTEVKVSVAPAWSEVVAGEIVPIAVVLDHQEGWHVHTNKPVPPKGVDPGLLIPTVINATVPLGVVLGELQWPSSTTVPVDVTGSGKAQPYAVFEGRAIVYVPLKIDAKAKVGDAIEVALAISYQACNERMCVAPEDVSAKVSLKMVATAPVREFKGDFARFDRAAAEKSLGEASQRKPSAGTVPPVSSGSTSGGTGASFFGVSLGGMRGASGFAVLALLGVAGGLILNLTPCVLPVIPIKVMTLTQHAGSPRRSMVLAAWMSAGVVAFWLGLGIPAAFVSAWADPSRIFGIWWVTTGIGVIIAAMGVGIMGLFTINLPQSVYMVNPKADTPGGSFLFGVMTAVLGLPCFGFVAGALLPAAAAIGATATLTVFGAMGVGMALPYALLAMNPKWLDRVPRTGPASELVKQVMGLLMLAASAYFIGSGLIALTLDAPWIGSKLHWVLIALLGVAAGAWLALRTWQITARPFRRAVFGLLGLLLAFGAIWPGVTILREARADYQTKSEAMAKASDGAPIPGVWNAFSERLVADALAQGKTVVMDFTAEWCLNCKTLKAAVLDRDPVRTALKESNVVMVEVDLTSTRAPGWEKLKALGQRGIPLLTIQGAGLKEPWLSGAYTSEQVMEALARAKGDARASR